jgi:hypothetical protein
MTSVIETLIGRARARTYRKLIDSVIRPRAFGQQPFQKGTAGRHLDAPPSVGMKELPYLSRSIGRAPTP